MLFDSHCHLNSEELLENIDQYIELAKKENITKMMVVSFDYDSCMNLPNIIKDYEGLYGAIGIFPMEIDSFSEDKKAQIKELYKDPKIKAVGEIGLDYHWESDKSKQAKQREVFIEQIKLANTLKLPIIVHSRDAMEDTYNILKEYPPLYGGVMHCYSGSSEMAKRFLDLGLYISLAGPVTFANAKEPKEVAKVVPLDRLLIETDSPYLSPVPFRGKINAPHNLVHIAKCIADIKGITYEQLTQATYENACVLFHVKH